VIMYLELFQMMISIGGMFSRPYSVTQQTFPYRADIGSMSEYRCRFPISGRHRADIGPIYIIALLSIFSNCWVFNELLMLIHLVFYIVNISNKCASPLINIKLTFPYRADIGSMSEYRCRFLISGRHRADINNCTVKYFFQLLSIQ